MSRHVLPFCLRATPRFVDQATQRNALCGLINKTRCSSETNRNLTQMAGISRVCTGSFNNPDIFRYTPFLPLKRRTISLRISWANPPLGSPCRCRFSRVSACVQASVQGIEKAIITQNGFLSDGERLFAMPNQGLAPRSFPAYLDKEVDFLLDWRRKCRCRHEKRQNV